MSTSDDHEFDVVVVGTGAAGLTAAVTAALRGLSVLVVEKTDRYGGTTAFSGGVVWIPNNPYLKRLTLNWYLPRVGLGDTFEKGREYLEAKVGDRVSPERREAFLQEGPEMISEFREHVGLEWRHWAFPDYYSEAPGGMSYGRSIEPEPFDAGKLGAELAELRPPSPAFAIKGFVMTAKEALGMTFGLSGLRGPLSLATVLGRTIRARLTGTNLVANGQSLIVQLRLALKQRDVPLWLSSPLVGLELEGEGAGQRVAGVRVRRNGAEVTVRARRGVVLATGGFARSQRLRQKYLPSPTNSEWSLVPEEGQDGDVIAIGQSVGAALDFMDRAWGFPAVLLTGKSGEPETFMALWERMKPGAMIVNAAGKRYFDECQTYEDSWNTMYAESSPGAETVPSWMIFDQRAKDNYMFFKVPPRVPFPRRWMKNRDILRAPSIEALAREAGLPEENLSATVSRFNEMARAGRDDDFHRGETAFGHFWGDGKASHPNLGPLGKAPFYAVRVVPGDLSTKGGLLTNERAEVVRDDGSTVEGLFAAGNCSSSVMGPIYPGGGGTIGPAMTFGYIAGKELAAREPEGQSVSRTLTSAGAN